MAKSPVGRLVLGSARAAFPRQAASINNAVRASAPIRKVVTSAVPSIINSKVTTSMTQVDTESYNFQVAGGPYTTTSSLEFLISPMNTTSTNGMAGQSWDPRLISDSARYKEYKVVSCSVIYSGGVSTTQNGTLYIGSGKNPSQSFPLTSEFSSLEKSIKTTFTDPQKFVATHDSEWHPMPDAAAVESTADLNVLYAGKVFLATAGGIQASWDAMKFDVHMVVQYRGRNPEYDILQSAMAVPLTNSTTEWLNLFGDSFRTPVPQTVTSTYARYATRLGLYKYTMVSIARNHAPCDVTFVDQSGADVSQSRILLAIQSKTNLSGAAPGTSDCSILIGDGSSFSTLRASDTDDRFIIQTIIAFCRPGDLLNIARTAASNSGIADCDYMSLNIIRVPRDKFVSLLKVISPASDPRTMMPVV